MSDRRTLCGNPPPPNPYQVIVTGKLRGQRAKGMKFSDGYMIKSGQASKDYIDESVGTPPPTHHHHHLLRATCTLHRSLSYESTFHQYFTSVF